MTMTYVVVGILVLIALGGALMFFVMNKTGGASPATPEPGDPTPAGDSPQHSDEASDQGGAPRAPDGPSSPRFKRDTIGGEAEGETTLDVGDAPTPEPNR